MGSMACGNNNMQSTELYHKDCVWVKSTRGTPPSKNNNNLTTTTTADLGTSTGIAEPYLCAKNGMVARWINVAQIRECSRSRYRIAISINMHYTNCELICSVGFSVITKACALGIRWSRFDATESRRRSSRHDGSRERVHVDVRIVFG